MPYERAVNAVDNSTLPLGVIRAELRYLSHLIRDEDIFMKEIYEMMDKKINVLKTETILSKVKCIMDVIRIWYDKDYESIISLGVYSTGCFGLPRGIVMSQPVCLSKAGYFVPCEDFPVTKHSQERILKIAKGLRHCIEQVKKQEEEQKKKMAIDNPLYTML
ncbi:unnamed protein product [Brassicogethes aeneus]|uniref:Lactate/malate dehydrogenase C-terminal domain-containing protein n=1 Tax=Brassicogethes aeneus TaxID=1431903 RepID=A0A9P0BCL2_BRAAE|nr:unnamed protein product [Brassicogethes aeneus]